MPLRSLHVTQSNSACPKNLLSDIFVNQWAVFAIVTLLLLALAEAGCRFGLASRRRNPDAADQP